MDDWKAFEILQFLLKGQYSNSLYKLHSDESSETHRKIEFVTPSDEIISIHANFRKKTVKGFTGTDKIEYVIVILKHLMGQFYYNVYSYELLGNAAYIGCVLEDRESVYYFNKCKKIYKLCLYYGFWCIFSIDDTRYTDISDICKKFWIPRTSIGWKYEEFVKIIMSSSIKSARN